jgi:precorrin-2 dehydrogenase / sirohydrochlorin ferrochelatase
VRYGRVDKEFPRGPRRRKPDSCMANPGQKGSSSRGRRGKSVRSKAHFYGTTTHMLTPRVFCQVAAGRILNCLNADANVTVVCPASGLNPEVAHRVAGGQIVHVDRVFEPLDLDGADMVLVAVDDPAASTTIWKLCKERKVPANIADVPPECDFYFGSVHRDGPLQIMVSTNGKGPRLAASIRKYIAKQLPNNAGNAIESIGALRVKLRKVAPRTEDGSKRMAWYATFSLLAQVNRWEMTC